jgi:hypothetical protein
MAIFGDNHFEICKKSYISLGGICSIFAQYAKFSL